MPKFREFMYAQAITNFGVLIADFLGIIFYVIAMRLPAAGFAEVRTISALAFIMSVTQLATRNFVILRTRDREDLSTVMRDSIIAGGILALCMFVIGVALAPVLKTFLHFSSFVPFVLVAGSAFPSALSGACQGVLSAQRSFALLAVSIMAEACVRIPLAMLLFTQEFQASDAGWIVFLASFISMAVTVIIGRHVWPRWKRGKMHMPTREALESSIAIVLSSLLLGMTLRVDLLWSKHVLSPEIAGFYGFLSLIASVLFLGTGGIGRAALSYLTGKRIRGIAFLTAGIIVLAASGGAITFFLIDEWAVPLVAPTMPPINIPVLLLLFGATTCYCLIHWFFQCLSVLHRTKHLLLSAGLLVIQVTGLFLYGTSMQSIALVQLLTMAFFACIFCVVFFTRTCMPPARLS